MNAVEFHIVVENGNIEIPLELKGQIPGPVRVIVLTEDKPKKAQGTVDDAIGKLLAHPIRLESFAPLMRDEIYGATGICVGRKLLAAVPPDVRKVSDLPATILPISLGATPQPLGHSPESLTACGKAEPYRTSGGTAAGIYPQTFQQCQTY